MGNQRGGSKTDTVVKLVLIFFISLLSFSVGTFVGKQVSDSDHRKAVLEGDYKGSRDTASVEEPDKQTGLSDDEIASLTEEFVNAEKKRLDKTTDHAENTDEQKTAHKDNKDQDHNKTKTEVAHSEQNSKAGPDGYKKVRRSKDQPHASEKDRVPASKAQQASKSDEKKAEPKAPTKAEKAAQKHIEKASKAAARLAKGMSPTKEHPKKRKPNSVLPSIASAAVGKYTVQVASYSTEGEAKSHAGELKNKGWNAFYIPAKVKGRTWYRVSVGLFTNSKTANSFKKELMREAKIGSAIVQKIIR